MINENCIRLVETRTLTKGGNLMQVHPRKGDAALVRRKKIQSGRENGLLATSKRDSWMRGSYGEDSIYYDSRTSTDSKTLPPVQAATLVSSSCRQSRDAGRKNE